MHPHLPFHSSGQNIGTCPNSGSLLGRFQIPGSASSHKVQQLELVAPELLWGEPCLPRFFPQSMVKYGDLRRIGIRPSFRLSMSLSKLCR